jgi:hypothetical protein
VDQDKQKSEKRTEADTDEKAKAEETEISDEKLDTVAGGVQIPPTGGVGRP